MNTQLYNELIEAKGNGTLGTVLREKFASLNINTEDEAQYLFDCVNEKLANMMMGASSPGFKPSKAKKISDAFSNIKPSSGNTRSTSLAKIIAGLSLAGIAAVPIGKMIANATTKSSTLTKILDANPDLKNDPKTKDHYDMLWHVAPNLASNHVIAGSVLEQLKAYDMIDHQMIAKLVEADKNMAESRSKAGPLSIAQGLSTTGSNLNKLVDTLGK